MREHLLSDVGAERSGGWNPFAVWKSSIHDPRTQRRTGQSWADYMDELEDRQLLRQRKLRRLATRIVCASVLVAAYIFLDVRVGP